MQEIKQLSQIEHVLKRPSMYVGSIVKEPKEEFILENDNFAIGKREYIPALIKIFNELIDNSIDEYVRTKGEYANKISVKMTDSTFEVQDNGRGIPNIKMTTLNGHEKYQAEVAFTEMLSGANYDNDDEATIGTNGLGAKASSIFSKKSVIKNDDGKKLVVISTKNNLSDIVIKEGPSKASGINSKITPDLEYFKIDSIDDVHKKVIQERLLHLSIAYPGITFRFNSKSLRLSSKKYFEMFNTKETLQINENVSIAIGTSESDSFEHFSLVNGLVTKDGGNHVKYLTDAVVNPVRDRLIKKFKTIKPGDIKNKLRIVIIFNNFMNARFTSQTKEEITNSFKEISDYLGEMNIDRLVKRVLKNDDIMLPITEYFLLKEQAKQNAELKKLNKTKKKIKSDKYLPATKNRKVLFLCEGASAVGGLMPSLGREDFGFYELKGVPLNAYDQDQKKFTNNPELSELYTIIQNEEYDFIATATDADADGSHIKGLLLGFFEKYLPEYLSEKRFGELQTPVQIALKNKKPVRWNYNLGETFVINNGETGKYMKGLGSYKPELLKHIIKTDGIDKMLNVFELDNREVLDDWLSSKKADTRKEYISENVFDITGI